MRDIKIKFQKRVELKNKMLYDGMYCLCDINHKDFKEIKKLITKIDEYIDGEYEYLNDAINDYYSDCKELKYWEIYHEKTGNKDDKYVINFYLYDLAKKCKVAENDFFITLKQAKEEDRRLI